MSERRATITDVAREAGVSPSTASVVFSGNAPASAETRRRVLAAAEAAVALAIALNFYNNHSTIDVDRADELKG